MNSSATSADDQRWELIPAAKFTAPSPPATDAALGGLRGAWYWLRGGTKDSSQAAPEELGALSADDLKHLALEASWDDLAQAVSRRIDRILESRSDRPVTIAVIVPPGIPPAAVLDDWLGQHAEAVQYEIPPRMKLLSDADDEPLEVDGDSLLAIDHLERCFVRHVRALDWIVRLVDQIAARRHATVVACGSWAWAYLTKAVHIDAAFDHVLGLAPFDGERLSHWLREMPGRQKSQVREFRDADTGELLLHADDNSDDGSAAELLYSLAAASRGNPAVALQIWRHALRTRPVQENSSEASDERGTTVWVNPHAEWDLPLVPPQTLRRDDMVLHTLLMHGGLAQELVGTVLPFAPDDILASLDFLSRHELIVRRDNLWQVTLLGYPDVRKHLQNEGYLVDLY